LSNAAIVAGPSKASLVVIAGLMLYQSVERLISSTPIHYDQAIAIAVVGLLVNLVCAWLLKDGHRHDHHHTHHEQENHGHQAVRSEYVST